MIISYDEKPGIQAIGNVYPDLMPVEGHYSTIARDYEYRRHGTLSLLAGIDLISGRIIVTIHVLEVWPPMAKNCLLLVNK